MKTSVIRLFERALRDARTELEHMPDLLILTREISRKEMLGEVLEKTWIKMSSGRNEGGLFPLAAERTVRLLKDRGLPEDQVAYHDNTFWLQLDHMKYSIRRDGFRYYIRYLGDHSACRWTQCHLAPEDFVKLLLEFDASVPEMMHRTELLYNDYLEMKRKAQKKEMIQKIMLATKIGKAA